MSDGATVADGLASGAVRLIHCYGHGGAGVTLSQGCALEVLRLYLLQPASHLTEAVK